MSDSSPAALAAMHDVVENAAAKPCLIIPTAVKGFNVYWKVSDGDIRVLIHEDGTLDLHFRRPALPDTSVSKMGIARGEIGTYL